MRGRAGSVATVGTSAVSTGGSGLVCAGAGAEGEGRLGARCARAADGSDGVLAGGVANASGSMGCGRGRRTCVCGIESGSLAARSGGDSALAAAGCGGGGVLARVNFMSHAESAKARIPARILEARRMRDASVRGHSRGDADHESRAFPRLAGEIDCTIVQLDDAERHGQPDTGARLLGREIQAEDFFLQLGTDSTARINDANFGIVATHRGLEA